MTSCDICVIGAGSGGLTVAAAAAQFGQKVVLIEKGEMGGDCLNTGCVPSKSLLAAAKHAQAMRSAAAFGIAAVEPKVDFGKVTAYVRSVIATIAPHDSQARFEGLGVEVIRAPARFTGPDTVEAGGKTITARRFVIATGSRPAIPDIPGLAGVPFQTNETIFSLDALPRHLVIIGGGPIGIELAQGFRRLGAQVSILEASEPLSREDPELVAPVLDALRREGVDIIAHAGISAIDKAEDGLTISFNAQGANRTVTGSHILVATGRKPEIEQLNLAAAGIASTARGITVDDSLRTSNPRVHAIGDVTGGPQFTHAASFHARLVIKNMLFRLPGKANKVSIPRVTYSDPELAQVGLTEAEARMKFGDGQVSVVRWPFRDNDRARTDNRPEGLVKVVTGRGGRILGAGITGDKAGELISAWTIAISQGLKIKALASTVLPYPTLGEAGTRAAVSYYSGLASRPWLRTVIRWLGKFG